MAAEKKKKNRFWLFAGIILLVVALFAAIKVFGPNTGRFTQGEFLYIHTGADYDAVRTALQEGGFIGDMVSFDFVARRAGLPAHLHPGKYHIREAMSNYSIVRLLRSGRQTPVKLVINKVRTQKDFITLLSANLEADSATLSLLFHDRDYLSQFGLDTNTLLCGVLPDTYDFFWNTTADKAFHKIVRNYARFWDAAHKQEAKTLGLTPTQVTIVASIVDEESNIAEDRPKIASVYLNRLNKGMKLQADPTVRFALGDFSIRRVTGPMLQTNSPYNTYMYQGLPPGPICTPATSSVEAVLQAPKTTYLYFCAKEDFSGYTNFASTFEEQMKNAHAYQKALDARGIH